MIEMIIGKPLTSDQQKILFSKSTMKLEKALWGFNSDLELDELFIKHFITEEDQ
jgi:hypothetical protein